MEGNITNTNTGLNTTTEEHEDEDSSYSCSPSLQDSSTLIICEKRDEAEVGETILGMEIQFGKDAKEEQNEIDCPKLDTLYIKSEKMDFEDESWSEEAPLCSSKHDISVLPLDVQLTEEESEGLEEVPVKAELGDSEDSSHEVNEGDDVFESSIKVEPLPESYVDRLNDFIKEVALQKLALHEAEQNRAHDSDGQMSNGHFLTKARSKKNRRSLKCEKCSSMFKYQSTYDYHVRSECGKKVIVEEDRLVSSANQSSVSCNVCQKVVSSRTSLMVHMRLHNGERPFVCDICSRSFTQKVHLRDHMNIHYAGRIPKASIHACAECGEAFTGKRLLKAHMVLHFGDKVFECDACHKRFRTRSNLRNHQLTHSGRRDHTCGVCGKAFLRRANLEEHIRVHTKEKPFCCEICGKGFGERSRWRTHVKRHTGELKQVCGTCGKGFACSYDLRLHERTHTGEKPFPCNICGRMFSRRAIMEAHMTIHTGRKDFVCVQCGDAFNRKSKLDVHLTSHTGENFCCEVCQRVFKCKAYLVPHMRTHLKAGGRSKCRCLFCGLRLKSDALLRQHILQSHSNISEPPALGK